MAGEWQLLESVRRLADAGPGAASVSDISRRLEHAVAQLFPGARASVIPEPPSPNDNAENPGRAGLHGGSGCTALPMVAAGRKVGTLLVWGLNATCPHPDPQEAHAAPLPQLQLLAQVAAFALANATAHDELRRTLERAREHAVHDPLTGLPNRVLLLDRLEQALERSRRSGRPLAVFFADLDRFKRVNDLYGHGVGDELLVAFAARLRGVLRRGDTAARLAGDEFVVLCENLVDERDAELIAAHLKAALAVPFPLSTGSVPMTASVGIAFAGHADHAPERLLEDADAAMYQAKRGGGARHQVLDLRERRRAQRQASLEQELHGAAQRGELFPLYQPIVATVSAAIVGVEALLRWRRPGWGLVPPAEFIPVAEQAGMITDIGRWVLGRACSDRRAWTVPDGPVGPELSVNVSAGQLMSPDLTATVASVLDVSGTDPAALTLEVTEDVFLQDSERALVVLNDLKSLGVMLALDDFGTGYSSLSYLKRFPFDAVKIDRSFVADLAHDPASHAIVYTVTELAHLLGMIVVAEGVETAAQHQQVTLLGCDFAQGFYFAPPTEAYLVASLLAPVAGAG